MDVVKTPGPDHPITVAAHVGRLQARFGGAVIADSADVLMLKEAHYKGVAYFPRADVNMALLTRTALDTYCPYKGHASYYSLSCGDQAAENAVWTYETPHPAMATIEIRLAFYPNHVTVGDV